MADGTQDPLLPVVAPPTPAAGDPVRSSLGDRFLSCFPRYGREKKPAPPPTTSATAPAPAPAPSAVSPASLAAAAAEFAEAAARDSASGDEARRFAEAARAFAEAARAFAEAEEEPRDPRFAEDLKARASALAVAADVILQQTGMPESMRRLAIMALRLPMDSQALLPAFDLLPASSAEGGVRGRETELQSLLRRAGQYSAGSSDGQPKDHDAVNPEILAAVKQDLSASGQKHDLNKASSQATKNRRFFPSAVFPFSLIKAPTEAAANPAGGEERPLEGDCADLMGKLEELGQCCRGASAAVADPTARLIAAIRAIATVDQANSRAKSEAKFEVILAAASLTMVASREEKVPVDLATTARKLASEATALLAKMGSIKPLQTGRSNDFLFCLTISGSLALLPYVSTLLPESLRPYVCAGFGIVFYAASAGAVLTFKATRQADLKLADVLNTFSFGLFSLLVVVFVCSALLSGNLILIAICALILFALHLYAWSRP